MKKKTPIYLFSQDISYKTFYKIWSKFPIEGIVPECMIKGKIIWQMIKNKQIYVYIDEKEKDDPIIFAVRLPKNRDVLLLNDRK